MNIPIVENAPLSQFTTFQLGGPCRGLVQCQTPDDLQQAVEYFVKEQLPFILIGGGSNLVVSDEGIDAYVIRYVSDKPLIEQSGDEFVVSGSTNLDELAFLMAAKGFQGVNCCSGIPGTVGGAVVGNAGAFGKQIGDVIQSVSLLTRDGQVKEALANNLGFTYRHSKLKETGDIVSEVRLKLTEGDSMALLKEREEILATRKEKHPDLSQEPCAGSFFRNIEPTSKAGKRQAAGWFLEQAGGKSLSYGGAYIYEKHANIIIKGKNCKALDVYELSQTMQKLVKEKHGLDLIREVRFVGNIASTSPPSFIW